MEPRGKRMEPLAVSVITAAEMLSCGRDTVYALVNSGQLASFKVGGRRLIAVSALQAFVASHVPELQPAGAER